MAGLTYNKLLGGQNTYSDDGRLQVASSENRGKTQVYKSAKASNNQTTLIYTVPSGKTLYISSAWLNSWRADAGSHTAYIYIDKAVDEIIIFIKNASGANRSQVINNVYTRPLIIEAGLSIRVHGNRPEAISTESEGGIIGWLE